MLSVVAPLRAFLSEQMLSSELSFEIMSSYSKTLKIWDYIIWMKVAAMKLKGAHDTRHNNIKHNNAQHNVECCYVVSLILTVVGEGVENQAFVQSVIMLSVIMVSVVAPLRVSFV